MATRNATKTPAVSQHLKITPESRNNVVSLNVVRNAFNFDTVKHLRWLLDEAMLGRVLGLAFVAQRAAGECTADIVGETTKNKTFARGMLATLEDRLRG